MSTMYKRPWLAVKVGQPRADEQAYEEILPSPLHLTGAPAQPL